MKQTKTDGWKYLLAGFFIPAAVMLIGYIVIGVWPFGNGTVLIIDSLHQYLPFYTELHEKLTGFDSLLYSFSAGLGFDFWATYAYYMASPLNFLMVLVPRANVADFMDFLILFKIGAAGGIFSWYLHRRDPKSRYFPVVFGTMFALSNFMIGYYFNLMWLDSIAVVPLIMYGIEKLVRGKSGAVYGISLGFALWCNYYIGFMLCIFSCIYLLVTVIAQNEWKGKYLFRIALRFAVYSLLAGGIGSVILIPAYLSLTSSESMLSNHFPTTIRFFTGLWEMVTCHFAAQEPINISDSQVGLNAYCGVSTLILVVLYGTESRIPVRERVSRIAVAGIFLLSFAMNIPNYIWHGFHVQNGLPNRFAFLYAAWLLIMAYDALGHIRQTPVWKIILAGSVPVIFTVLAMLAKIGDLEDWMYLLNLLILLVYSNLLILVVGWPRREKIFHAALAAAMLIEAAACAIYGIICNDSVTRDIYLKDQASYQQMLGDREDFFRSEFDSQRMRNVTMYAGGNSMVMFNSTMPEAVTDLCDALGMEARTNKNGYNGVTTLVNDVFGIRYVLSSNGKADTLYQFPKIAEDDNLALYENADALSIGYLVDPAIRDWDIHMGNPMDVQNQFAELAAGVEGPYVLDRCIEMQDEENYRIRIPDGKQVYVYLPERIEKIELNTPEYSKKYTTYTDHLYVIDSTPDESEGNFTAHLKSSQTKADALVYTCKDESVSQIRDILAQSQLEEVQVQGNHLQGKIQADKDGILLITVPYSTNWTLTVDGQESEYEKIGNALMGVMLTEGSHQIDMKYRPAGLTAGMILTFLSLLGFAAVILWEKKRDRQEQLREEQSRKEEETDMELKFSDKAESFEAGIFAILNEKKEELLAKGRTIYNLSVGTPDFKPSENIMKAVSEAAKNPDNYKYALKDLPTLTSAMQDFYQKRFGVTLEKDEIMSIYGSQEGMAHIAWTLCNPGDLILVPNPGYPIFKIGPLLCDAKVWEYPLTKENHFLPDLKAIPEEIAKEAKAMVVNYPSNPTCVTAPDEFYQELVAFAEKNQIIIIHDNAYSDIVFGGKKGMSFLGIEGAKDVGVEFYSLSKSFDYTGARMSFVVGNRQIIEKFQTIRSQIDYGIFLPVQYGAIAALKEPEDAVLRQCEEYERRNHTLCAGLRSIGWEVPDSEASMFVWAPLPDGYTNSDEFCLELMERSGVICVPGSSFGSLGEGYVRFALVMNCEQLEQVVESIRVSGILDNTDKEK